MEERRQWKKRDEREKLVNEKGRMIEDSGRREIKVSKLWKKRDERENIV